MMTCDIQASVHSQTGRDISNPVWISLTNCGTGSGNCNNWQQRSEKPPAISEARIDNIVVDRTKGIGDPYPALYIIAGRKFL